MQNNLPMSARYFAFQFQNSNNTQVVLYGYETAVFSFNGTSQTKSIMISVITFSQVSENVTALENQELPIATSINNYWTSIQPWSIVALTLSKNGLVLSMITVAILVALILCAAFYNRQGKKPLLNLYAKLPQQKRCSQNSSECAAKWKPNNPKHT